MILLQLSKYVFYINDIFTIAPPFELARIFKLKLGKSPSNIRSHILTLAN